MTIITKVGASYVDQMTHWKSTAFAADVTGSLLPPFLRREPGDKARRRESGQIPIIISFLTCQEFLGVLIDLVANGSTQLPILACC